jgi:transposase-like protein
MSNRKRPSGRPSKYPPSSSVTRWRWCSTKGVRSPRSLVRSGQRGHPGELVARARRERSNGAGLSADERAELVELRAECAQLRMERDLLKRSMAFWVRELAP